MQKERKLNNGVLIPMIGLGIYLTPAAQTANVVEEALGLGYRHIDGAAAYGNEQGLGEGIRRSGLKREEVFVTTKLWNEAMRLDNVLGAFEQSLENLGLDYVDLYLIHWPVSGKFVKSYKVMEKLQEAGKIRAIGVCNFKEKHLDALMQEASILPAVNQVERHPYLSQKPLLDYCSKLKIALEAYSPFGGDGAPMLRNETLAGIAQKYEKTVAQIILRWNLQQGVIALPKTVNPERMASNMDLDFVLGESDMSAIDALNRDERFGTDPDHFDF